MLPIRLSRLLNISWMIYPAMLAVPGARRLWWTGAVLASGMRSCFKNNDH
jgi:hypothetical protein